MKRYNAKGIHIDPAVYQHPADKAASDAIKASEAFQKVLRFISKNGIEKWMQGMYRASLLQITPTISPEIYGMMREAQEMFDAPCIPDVFITRTYPMQAVLTGAHQPVLTISSELLRQLDEDMLWGMMASEVGGIKSGFGEIKLIEWLCQTVGNLLPPGVAQTLQVLLKNWHRYAQYTFDRTTLIATGDLNTTMRFVLLGEAPIEIIKKIDFANPDNSYMRQCRTFLEDKDLVANTLRTANAVLSGGAFYASRYMELFNFYQSDYYDILEACE